jgi:exonuclease III
MAVEPDIVKILTVNVCYVEEWQGQACASFIAHSDADIVFLQETNGGFSQILEFLRANTGWGDAVGDTATCIILRDGVFLPKDEEWPHAFYSRALVKNRELVLVNIHLCENNWLSSSNHQEERYRVRYLRRMLDHLGARFGPDSNIVIAGDFNSPSHLDRAMYEKSSPEFIDLFSNRTSSCSTLLEERGYIDTWTACNSARQGYVGGVRDSKTWPAPPQSIADSRHLKSQISAGDPAARIDMIYTKGSIRPIGSRITCWRMGWFSDHCAVESTVEIFGEVKESFDRDSVVTEESFDKKSPDEQIHPHVQLSLSDMGRWTIASADGLSGEPGAYLDVWGQRRSGQWLHRGWFYLDGLHRSRNVPVSDLYTWSTFSAAQELPDDWKEVQWTSTLYLADGGKVSTTPVQLLLVGQSSALS